ncbi:unnamed protein product [Didymodactylos carnosus]|uniref:RZ-type domain-containing protein n=1 Tax=Didymodactylos carnosus TaxID=1234261 RepID=A0A8S2FUR3_9BILA|nr:unnamed protein product [Didymodactylos carnosus]CAF4346774.1 unnamed protein product [Didymodactylos carnosus]
MDPIVKQMEHVKKSVQERLDGKKISEQGKFIYQCSKNCSYMYYFENCGMANDRSKCQLCGLDIGVTALNQLIKRDSPQIQLSINNAFEQIDQYFLEYEKKLNSDTIIKLKWNIHQWMKHQII